MARRRPVVLVVDDLGSELEKYLRYLREFNYDAIGARTLDEAKAIVSHQHLDLILTDLYLGSNAQAIDGLDLIAYARDEIPKLPVIAMSSDPRLTIAEEARKRGADQMIRKPIKSADELAIIIKRILEPPAPPLTSAWPQKIDASLEAIRKKHPDGIVISDQHLRYVELAADNPELVVCIYGETGTGKEEIAKLIHRRRSQHGPTPFVSINCANLQGDLLISTLFGHKKGAFTGANENTVGAIGQSDGGILFLDEIHRLPMKAQELLLRVLNDGSYKRIGDSKELKSSFQILIASTKDLDQEVENGSFLIDLRMRLIGLEIKLSPLRDRLQDMADFVNLFLAKQEKPVAISQEEKKKLIAICESFYWQGNIRQLYKVLQVFLIMSTMNDEPLQAERIPIYKTMYRPGDTSNERTDDFTALCERLKSYEFEDSLLDDALAAVEKWIIARTLRRHATIADACKALGISRSNIDMKRKKFGI
ncbi:MAG TPA: sigma 54-interacting transcriptional regulator [Oligoflexus sp.]|uniref:sigma-54-dependent transcriptional regulator n=1 Tax=Oligoflexus sp. TaxID=1971216 RepID=UPI002D7F7672|nr:sigma 54-interacting transcriptional regulator [Oligoflexus sp.]HET9238174.1 sigma 54-interacting transcriptional regulator [Oligoflexus sp.]